MQYAGSSINRRLVLGAALGAPFVRRAVAATTLNAYSIWPENYARPVFAAFQAATGVQVNFLRFSSGEALARIVAEKGNPQVDLLFGGPIETFTAGIGQGVFAPYASPDAATLPARFKGPERLDGDRRRPAGVHDQHRFSQAAQSGGANVVE